MTWHVLDMARPVVRRDERFSFNCTCKCVAVKPRRTSRGTGHRPAHPAPRLSSATRTATEARRAPTGGRSDLPAPYDATLLARRARLPLSLKRTAGRPGPTLDGAAAFQRVALRSARFSSPLR